MTEITNRGAFNLCSWCGKSHWGYGPTTAEASAAAEAKREACRIAHAGNTNTPPSERVAGNYESEG